MKKGTKLWTKPERVLVMAEMLRIEQQEDSHLKHSEWIARAQKVLPNERQHSEITYGISGPLIKKMRSMVASGHLEPAKQAPPTPPPTPPPADDAGPEIIVVEKKVIVRELPDYGRISTTTLARILLERLAHLEQTEASLMSFTQSYERRREQEKTYDRRLDPRPAPEQPKEEPIRICIIGLLPEQQHEVEAKTANVSKPIKLRFYDGHTGPQDLPQILDYVIASRFVRHGWWEKAKAALPADCVFFLSGGVQEIIQKVYDLASRQTSLHLNGNVGGG